MDNNENIQKEAVESQPVQSEPAQQTQVQTFSNNGFQQAPSDQIPAEYKPISMWGYFGCEILFSIPCVGLILLCVFSFGGTTNVNLKNFARSYFCFLIIGLIVLAIIFAIFGAAGLGAAVGSGGIETSVSQYQ